MTDDTSGANGQSPEPSNSKSPRLLAWLVLAVLVLVCAALFRGTARVARRGVGSDQGSVAKQSGFEDASSAPSESLPCELLSAVKDPRVAAQNAAIYLALEKMVRPDYETWSLEESINDVGRQLDVPVWFDRQTLADEGVAMDQPVTIHLRGISGRSALALIMEPVQLNWVIGDEVLKITTSVKAGEKLEVRVYDVTDLVVDRDAMVPGRFEYNSLMNVIQTCVHPDSWYHLAGPGSTMPVTLPDGARTLAIRQTQAGHDKVQKLLANLRKARRTKGDDGVRPIVVSADESPAARREVEIRQALNKPVKMRVRDRPLEEVVHDIARQADIPFVLDRATLTDEGVPIDAPVSVPSSENTARSALNLVLNPLQLTWVIRNEVLFITTSAKAGELMEARVYDMTDIAPKFRSDSGSVISDLNSISRAIRSTIQPDSDWGNGPGIIVPYRSAGIFALVFPQTRAVHEEVADFLEQLRDLQRTRATLTRPKVPVDVVDAVPQVRGLPRLLLDSRRDAIVHGNNQFALELYAKLAQRSTGNLLVSPQGISSAVAMAYAGARGHTAREIDWTMHYNLRQEDVPDGFRTLRVSSFLLGPDSQVAPVSQVWIQPGMELLEPFQKTLSDVYGTKIATVDFSDPAGAAQVINDLAVAQTNGSLLRVVNPGDFGETTRFVVTNAVRFHGKWSQLFHPERTRVGRFSTAAGELEVAMMHLETARARYAVVDGVQVLDKTYGNGDLSMVVLLPLGGASGIADLERSFDESRLAKWLTAEDSKHVEVYLPRFKLEAAFPLRRELETLGMRTAFDQATADFSGISKEKLALGEVISKAGVEVDEQGPRAAPGTAGPESKPAAVPENQPIFRADHPFLFLIRDNRTGSILFIGRVVNPGL